MLINSTVLYTSELKRGELMCFPPPYKNLPNNNKMKEKMGALKYKNLVNAVVDCF